MSSDSHDNGLRLPDLSSDGQNNPYEDAISQALQLLRKHDLNQDDSHQEDQTSSAMYSQEIEMRRKQRQERMAKYAHRLAELKDHPSTPSDDWQSTPASSQDLLVSSSAEYDDEDLLELLRRNTATGAANNQPSSPSAIEDVAQNLQDMLRFSYDEQGMSTDCYEGNNDSWKPTVEDDLDHLVRLSQDYSKDDSIDRRVRQVLEQQESNGRQSLPPEDPSSFYAQSSSYSPASSRSSRSSSRRTPESDRSSYDDSDVSKSRQSSDASSYSSQQSPPQSSYSDHEAVDGYDDRDSGDDSEYAHGVLGPRARGDKTRVQLDTSTQSKDTSDDDENAEDPSSITIMESLSSALSFVTGSPSRDKYAGGSTRDNEVQELMLSLCAHILPYGIVRSHKLLERRPEWDESDADEPGYRIIRLSQRQVRAIDLAFDRMVSKAQTQSQNELQHAQENSDDDAFERDLQAAEELLDREEHRLNETEKAIDKSEFGVTDSSNETPIYLAGFSGVKKLGQGQMGEMEFFHLPIIFKSHVTGFEPTKDLFLEPGNVFAGQYLVESELGSAAFSTAYRCVDLGSSGSGPDGHESVCLKVIKNTKDFFDQSLDEIKILELLRKTGGCKDNNIVEMKKFFYHREHLIIVTELLRQNLFEFGKFITQNNEEPYFTIDRLGYITRQILVALRFIHNLGLVHSDVKPENILLSSYSRAKAKLIDFGSSCYLTDRQSSYIQSRSYRAPEVILGLPYDGRIDVWSMGCVVAEMFTGDVTFQNDSVASMMSRIEAICGAFPRHMVAEGRQSSNFFTGCGLIFEKTSARDSDRSDNNEEDEETSDDDERVYSSRLYDVYQPKKTSLVARLGFSHDLLGRFDSGLSLSETQQKQALFADFIRKLLTVDPDARPSAHKALKHPFMKYVETLAEEDILYQPQK